jgi:hypothetical protein
MTTQNQQTTPQTQKGCWIIPKNLPISHSVQDMGALISDSEELSKACEQSLTANEMLSPHQTWSRKLKKDTWMQLLSGRILKTSHTKIFSELWTSCLGASHVNLSQLQVSKKQKEVKSFYTHHFQGALGSAAPKLLSSKMSKDYDLFDLITPCQSNTSISIEQTPSYYTSSETWKIWDMLAIFDLKLRAESVFPIQGGVFLLGQSGTISRLNKFKNSLLDQSSSQSKKPQITTPQPNTDGKVLDLWTFSQLKNKDQYIDVETVEKLLEAYFYEHGNFDETNDATEYLPPEKYDQVQTDTPFTTDVQTHLGKVRIHQHKIKHRYSYRTNRAGLHGNGVVPQMCSVAVHDLLKIILIGKISTDYLPYGFSNLETLEKALENQKTSFNKIKNSKIYNQNKTKTQQLIQTFWPTPTKRDEKDAVNRKIAKDRIKEGSVTISRATTNPGQIFYQHYVHNNLIPQPFQGQYPETTYNPNQNWVESLMGLQSGWTQPLFEWDDGNSELVDSESDAEFDSKDDTENEET